MRSARGRHLEGEPKLSGTASDIDTALNGALSQLIELGDIKCKRGEITMVPTFGRLPSPRVVVAGLGRRDALSRDVFRTVAAEAARYLRAHGVASAAVAPSAAPDDLQLESAGKVIAEGALLGLYTFSRHKSSLEESAPLQDIAIVGQSGADAAALVRGVERGRILANAANLARDLENEPSNYTTPTELANRAKAVADESGVECQVLDREDMVGLGMGALPGVAKGSYEEPKFIVLAYRGDPSTDRAIGFVGKGVTFDTGGLSIKPAQGMEEMKGDMSGGASVIAALSAIARLRPKVNVTGIVPTTENMPGGAAIKPGDVLVAMSGKTIEVINTDAEGRLILADGLAYARRLDLSPIIDVATLTGAVSIALGDVALGVFSNDDQLVEQLKPAAGEAGEKLWQLPPFEEHREQIKSEVADIKNTGGRKAGSATAAWFLAEFVDSTPWAHLDIAGVDTYEHEMGWIVKGASGIPVRTLIHFVLDRAGESAEVTSETAATAGD
ncbi:MAG TPA: leucyl aminopeptidase [Dehalococcoidia bacterium]|nr:leucyl aminopeptidase [Dehalococcoidia bacterium]